MTQSYITARHCSELFSILSQSPSWTEHPLPVEFHIVEALLGNPHKFHRPAPPPSQAIIIFMQSFSLIHEKRHFNDKLSKCDEKRYTSVVWLSPRFLLRVDIKAIALESSVRGAVSVHSSLLRCIISESFQTPRVLSSRDVQTFLLAEKFFTIESIEITHNYG